MVRDYEEPIKKFIEDMFPKPSEALTEVEVAIEEEEVPIEKKKRGRSAKIAKEKRVEATPSQRPKRFKK